MTTTERDLLIAEAMGLRTFIDKKTKQLCVNYNITWNEWSPSESAEQREMIKAKLKEWKYSYNGGYDLIKNEYWYSISDHDFKYYHKKNKISESEAFLEAVGELCQTLKNQK